jgi:hypothetical protein
MTAAAITGPAPKMPVRLVPAPRTAASIFLRVWRIWASMPRRPAACSAASSQRAAATAPAGVTDSRIRPAWPAVICFQAPPGISPQHGMQPAGHLGAGAAQVLTPPGPDLEHSRVILPAGRTHASRAQCRDRDRAGVVRVVLVRVPRGQQPHPGRELGPDVQHALPGGGQLPGQQVPRAVRALDRPGPLRPGRSPGQQPLHLIRAGAYPQLTQLFLSRAERGRRARALVRADAGHHHRHGILPFTSRRAVKPWRACLIPGPSLVFAPLSGHATAKPRQASTSLTGQATPAAGSRFESQPNRDLSTLRNPAHCHPGQVSGVYLQ